MTQAASGSEHTSHYALKPRNPVRAWAIAACLLIAGVVALWTGLAGEAANVALVVKVDGKEVTTRVGSEREDVTKRRADGSEYPGTRGVRIARKTGKEI